MFINCQVFKFGCVLVHGFGVIDVSSTEEKTKTETQFRLNKLNSIRIFIITNCVRMSYDGQRKNFNVHVTVTIKGSSFS